MMSKINLKMGTLFLSCLLFSTSLNPSEITFKEASAKEWVEIQQHLISFYGEQLLDAGLFEDLGSAIEAATTECNQCIVDNLNKEFYCYHLVSKDFFTQYGYLIYSINDRTAYLDAVYLEKIYRGQGLGKKILKTLETELKKKDVETIRLYVFAKNVAAFTLYDRMGYSIEKAFSNENKLIGYHMKKHILSGIQELE